ncbi:MAG TPA: hypothetical protein PKN85_01945 [Syntrophorhabdaceae bacterium]|nr:hypothetical protein [Syntrophorhabdaceae bacterium]HOD76044.1 hypothetical protein [Syntrophorhabdaceae bacterium]
MGHIGPTELRLDRLPGESFLYGQLALATGGGWSVPSRGKIVVPLVGPKRIAGKEQFREVMVR